MSNSVFIGYPVIAQAFGQDALVAIALAEMNRNQGHKTVFDSLAGALLAVLKNPIVQAIAAGLLFSILGIGMPAVIGKVIDLFAASSAAVGLFVIGGTLVGLRIKQPRLPWYWRHCRW